MSWYFKNVILLTTLETSTKIFVGYSTRNGSKFYPMFNLKTKIMSESSDIFCLKFNYVIWMSFVENSHKTPIKEQNYQK